MHDLALVLLFSYKNIFIREEIRRIKTENPRIAHKEAFSTAAKNVSWFSAVQVDFWHSIMRRRISREMKQLNRFNVTYCSLIQIDHV